ncbi:aspartate aminotransferase family protein [Glutamicibacter endophyticus]|uniref:aspartate aminotransferase family protein n=1 Tax=Glutamicibacter endophyticus TaxID=1522174 RepID=UPI003AF18ADB
MTNVAPQQELSPSTAALMARRVATLGPHSPLFYDTPLELVSGRGVWLTDAAERTYLDAYNNVPHVGHANEVVADAVNQQMRTLNLHTRYLNHMVVDYAETLLETFGAHLNRLFLVNSGSEANELALRIARQHTGNTGILVSDFSYHGNTTSLAELTTGLTVREPFGAHVRAIRVPDATGLDEAQAEALRVQALAEVDRAIDSLQQAGFGISASLFDLIFSTEGLLKVPAGYVEGLAQRVQTAGGLFIADEVQSGFGRLGTHMWGHQLYDITPDLVTLGKPMGNGHPVGAVVTTEALLDEFGRHNMYFNTFAGSPVSSAAGLAVLSQMRDRNLMENAVANGQFIADAMREIAKDSPIIGAVRGQGLFFGYDIVQPDNPSAPNAAATKQLIELMKAKGVLISRIGRHDNVLKMRPPMVIEREQAQLLVETLAGSVCEARATN